MPFFPANTVIVSHPKHLTTHWAQQIISKQEPGKQVKNVTVISINVGTTTRVRIKVDHTGSRAIPNHWFVKIPSLSWRAKAITALPRLLHIETRFYKELAHHTPIAIPNALSAQSKFGRGSTLVLNDVAAQGAIPGAYSYDREHQLLPP